jgi:hypothetical protein
MLLRLKTSHLSKLLVLLVLTGCFNKEETVVEKKSEENKVQEKVVVADQAPVVEAPATAKVSLEEEEEAVKVEASREVKKPAKKLEVKKAIKKVAKKPVVKKAKATKKKKIAINKKEVVQEVSTKDAAVSKSSTSTSSSTSTAQVNTADPTLSGGGKKLVSILYADLSSNLYKYGSTSNRMGSSAMGIFIYRANKDTQLLGSISATKQLTGLRESAFGNSFFAYRRLNAYSIGKGRGNLEARFFTAFNENQRKNQYKRGQLRLQSLFMLPVNSKLLINYTPRISRHFYKFKQSRTGTVNTEWTASHVLTANYSFAKKWSVNLTAFHSKGRNFEGTTTPDSYSFSQELQYIAAGNLFLGFGHTNSGQLIETDRGPDDAINFYGEDSSTIYTSMTYIF